MTNTYYLYLIILSVIAVVFCLYIESDEKIPDGWFKKFNTLMLIIFSAEASYAFWKLIAPFWLTVDI